MKKILTIAGSDCSGGAGIQADLKTMTSLRCYGMSVITSLTSQNTIGVQGIFDVPPNFIKKQLGSVYSDITPDAVKIGMVSNEKNATEIYKFLKTKNQKNIVLDPVIISSTKAMLISQEAIKVLRDKLFKISTIITPNIYEAEVLSKIKIRTKKDFLSAAKIISPNSSFAVLIKGGHLAKDCDDFLYFENKPYWFKAKKINNKNTHGTGCTLSSAIACFLAQGNTIPDAVQKAKQYVLGAIKSNLKIGNGIGPLNHTYDI